MKISMDTTMVKFGVLLCFDLLKLSEGDIRLIGKPCKSKQ
jgi:hypothetical protein